MLQLMLVVVVLVLVDIGRRVVIQHRVWTAVHQSEERADIFFVCATVVAVMMIYLLLLLFGGIISGVVEEVTAVDVILEHAWRSLDVILGGRTLQHLTGRILQVVVVEWEVVGVGQVGGLRHLRNIREWH